MAALGVAAPFVLTAPEPFMRAVGLYGERPLHFESQLGAMVLALQGPAALVRSYGSSNVMTPVWLGQPERGSRSLMAAFAWVTLTLGRAFGRLFLPPVAFYKPAGILNQHPGYAGLMPGDEHLGWIVHLMQQSPMRDSFAIFVIYDEFGGQWDHVAPPAVDAWGPGTRIPALVLSQGFAHSGVDHTTYDTTSILKLIETRFGLAPLGDVDARADGLSGAFEF